MSMNQETPKPPGVFDPCGETVEQRVAHIEKYLTMLTTNMAKMNKKLEKAARKSGDLLSGKPDASSELTSGAADALYKLADGACPYPPGCIEVEPVDVG